MKECKIICKIMTGSHLYGTARPDSDEDYIGVFIPSTDDLLSTYNVPKEWTENEKNSDGPRNTTGDVDCKFVSLQRFLKFVAEGQSLYLEMLFAPEAMVVQGSEEWDYIVRNRRKLLSKRSIAPFIGFAMAQAHKAVIKGENLNKIRRIIELFSVVRLGQTKIHEWIQSDGEVDFLFLTPGSREAVDITQNVFGATLLKIAGRSYDVNSKMKTLIFNLKELAARYGTRSQDAANASHGLDLKSLSHAYRLLHEAEEVLTTGAITLPLPAKIANFMIALRAEDDSAVNRDHFDDISMDIKHIEEVVVPSSLLPDKPKYAEADRMCRYLLEQFLGLRE